MNAETAISNGIFPAELTLDSVALSTALTKIEKLAWAAWDTGRYGRVVGGSVVKFDSRQQAILRAIDRKVSAR